ncbi:Hypothetical protein, putative [Bodo saltans]|uniref:Uncharacterized protein n=1 Tax=Bodo saltans TaxID=75058 RepID=A0A0S4JHJ2_BODSA|nr:Hypothetical protein, putative [Bodo saltans]|eukprot:CUG88494.1 Hypothetical protein, putative [Bodo saltans]
MNRWCAATLRPERASQYCKDWRPRASTLTLGGRYHLTTYVSTTPPLINAPIARTPECRRWADHHNANATFIEINQLSEMVCRAQSQRADATTLVPSVVLPAWQGFETDNESSSSSESHSVATPHNRRPVYIKPRIELIGVIMNSAPFEINNIRSPRLPSSVWCPLLDPSIIINDTFFDSFSRPPLSKGFIEQIKDNVPSFQDTAIREWVATARALATSTRDDMAALDLIHSPQWKSTATTTKLSPIEVRRCWERVCGFESTILNLLRSIFIYGGDVGRRVKSPRDTCTAWFDWNTLATAAHDHNITTSGNTKEMISMLMGTAKYTDSAVESDSCEALRAWYQEYPAQRRKDLLKFLVATFDALNTSPEVKGY